MMKFFHVTAAAVVACILAASPARAQQAPPAITVTGEAQRSVAPDMAQIEAGVSNTAKTARAASEANDVAMGQVLLALKAAGIDAKDYQTAQLSLQPQYADHPGPSAITGYVAKNIVTIKVREIQAVPNVVDKLVGAGTNEIRGISFSVSNASKVLDDARRDAIADARRKAEIYAAAAGVTLGAPLSIAEETAPNIMPMRKMAAPFAARAPVAPGEETLGVVVAVSWAIKSQ